MLGPNEDDAWQCGTVHANSRARWASTHLRTAISLLEQGQLTGIASFHQSICLRPDGSRTIETVGVDVEGECDWHVTVPPGEEVASGERLLVEHARWLAARSAGAELCKAFRDIAGRHLAGSECAIVGSGACTSDRLHGSLPQGVILVEARGHDTRPNVTRLASLHEHDIGAGLDRLVGLSRRAAEAEAAWRAAGAIAAIEAPAFAMAKAGGIDVVRLIASLEDAPKVAFGSASGPLRGSFVWRDCAISVVAHHRSGWTIDGDVLTIRRMGLAHTFRGALTGSPLSQLATLPELPSDIPIAAVAIAGEDLRVTLERRRILVHRRAVHAI